MSYDESVRVESPGRTVSVRVGLREGRPAYDVGFAGRQIVAPSPMGLEFETGSLADGFDLAGVERDAADDTWEPVWGRYDEIRERYRELRVELDRGGPGPSRLDVVVRAFEDGVGLRYELPEQDGLSAFAVADERTGFDLAADEGGDGDADVWWIPGDYDSYEYLYDRTAPADVGRAHTPLTARLGPDCYLSVHEAALRDYAAMTVSGPAAGGGDERVHEPEGTPFTATLTPLPDGTKVRGETPHRSPWRTVQLGRDPGALVESSLVVTLNDPPEVEAEWVEPDTYVGVWWEMHVGKSTWSPGPVLGATTGNAKRYAEFAGEHGIGNLLVEGWNDGWAGGWDDQDFTTPNPQYDPEAVAEYASERGVDLIAHCETGGQFRAFEAQLEDAFSLYERLGASGVKTGYVTDVASRDDEDDAGDGAGTGGDEKDDTAGAEDDEDDDTAGSSDDESGDAAAGGDDESGDAAAGAESDEEDGSTDLDDAGEMPGGHRHHDQRLVNHHHRVVEAAAEHGLVLDAHEGVKPTGLRRTYPNFVTRECVRGMEFNAWSEGNPPRHTVVLPFTRMLAGPLDYTPGIFAVRFPEYDAAAEAGGGHDYEGPVRVHTTRARQLALLVILFSGLQMAADLPEHYEGEPEFAFVEAVPADWDDTRVPNAVIGEHVTVARRHGEEWFVASATDDSARELTVPLDFLGEGSYEARIYRDADVCDLETNPEAVAIERETVTAGDELVAEMVAGGGHAVHIVPE